MSDPKYVSRFPPCPVYDVEGMESWLEDLAKHGLLLTKGGLFCGFAEFEKTTPRPMRYRMQPLPKKKFMEDAGPYAEAVDLAKEFGWEYLCTMGEFSVYACGDPNARELNTDPQVQAMTYRQMYKRKRNDILSHFVGFCLVVGLLVWHGPLTFLLDHPIWYTGLMALIWLSYPFVAWGEMKQLKELKQKLALGEPLSRRKNWRKGRHLHWLSAILSILFAVSFFTAALLENFVGWEDSHWQPVSEYQGELPFATMEDLAGKGTFTGHNWYVTRNNNEIAVRSTLVAKTQLVFQQFGSVSDESGELLDGTLQIECYDLRTKWLAKALFREIHHQATLSSGKYDTYQDLEIPELPVEQFAAYSTRYPILLMRQGTEVIEIQFIQFSRSHEIPLDQWTAIEAEYFLRSSD